MSWNIKLPLHFLSSRIKATIGFALDMIRKCECEVESSKLDECAKHLRLAVQALQGE